MKKYVLLGVLSVVALFNSSDSFAKSKKIKQKKLENVMIGMTKNEVINILGSPSVKRGAQVDSFGNNVEVFEYLVDTKSTGQFIGEIILSVLSFGLGATFIEDLVHTYWLYFQNDKLVQWGKANDWKTPAPIAYDINVNSTSRYIR